MTVFIFSVLLLFFSFLAGIVGALTGLGGGVVIIPTLVLLFHINLHYAMGASLISVIATSSGSSIAYLRGHFVNLRIGLFLEVAAVIGALIGAILVAYLSKFVLTFLFSLVLLISAYLTLRRHEEAEKYETSHAWATYLNLDSTYTKQLEKIPYRVQHVPIAFIFMGFAGMISGLLGIGSGALKVLAMDQSLRLPYKVSTTTSSFMIGITAAVSAGVYFARGYIDPTITFPVLVGVLIGAMIGTRLLTIIPTHTLRIFFSIVITIIALQMLYNAWIGSI